MNNYLYWIITDDYRNLIIPHCSSFDKKYIEQYQINFEGDTLILTYE